MPDQALSDIKVLDFSHYIAGPYCTKLLADMGADVVKVEPPGIGDPSRGHCSPSALSCHCNKPRACVWG